MFLYREQQVPTHLCDYKLHFYHSQVTLQGKFPRIAHKESVLIVLKQKKNNIPFIAISLFEF